MSLRMLVAAGVIVRMRVVLGKDLVGEQIIFSERLIVPVSMSASVGAAFGMERRAFLAHRHAQLEEHLVQDWIGLKLEEICPEFDRCVTVSQMVCGSHQGVRCLGGHPKDAFCGGFHPDQRPVFCLQKIAITQYGSTRQKERRFRTVREHRSEPALPPKIERQDELWQTVEFSLGGFAICMFFNSQEGRHLSK